jgi:hypothetical protein
VCTGTRDLEYKKSVFINCPFDRQFQPLFRAIVFAIYHCGFNPVSALMEDNALNNRVDKICRIIRNCKYGLHDISRTELNNKGFPRFNMPFELGLFYGARNYGNKSQRVKTALIMERNKYSYQKFLSDISGVDIRAHKNDPKYAISHIRSWLQCESGHKKIVGMNTMLKDYLKFTSELPEMAKINGFRSDYDLNFTELLCLIKEFFSKR